MNLVDACVLVIKAMNIYDVSGILAPTSTGVVSDASWKCSSAVKQSGCHLSGFEDTARFTPKASKLLVTLKIE